MSQIRTNARLREDWKLKVVLTDYAWHPIDMEKEALGKLGAEIVSPNLDYNSMVLAISDADVIIQTGFNMTEEIIKNLDNCKAIIHTGIGVDTIDVQSATKKGIIVSNVIGYCIDEVANHSLMLLLASWHKVIEANNQVRRLQWSWENLIPIHRLRTAVVGIIGFGKIGQAFLERIKPLCPNILVFDPFQTEKQVSLFGVELVDLQELCSRSDLISVHCPLTKETTHLIGEKEIGFMKKQAYIINTARGQIIDEKALIDALKNKRIAGAALDVLKIEPINPGNGLLNLDNVILTPHQAFYSEESILELRQGTIAACENILKNRLPDSVVNPEVLSNSNLKQFREGSE